MARKKHNRPPSWKQPAKASPATNAPPSEASSSHDASRSAIILQCDNAVRALQIENYRQALRLINDCFSRYADSPHSYSILCAQAKIHAVVARLVLDPGLKSHHSKIAVESARRAAELRPSSIKCAHFYATLLYENASESRNYREVIAECMRGFALPGDILEEGRSDGNGSFIDFYKEQFLVMITDAISKLEAGDNAGAGPVITVPENSLERKLLQVHQAGSRDISRAIESKTEKDTIEFIDLAPAVCGLLQMSRDKSQSHGGKRLGDTKRHVKRESERKEVLSEQVKSFWNSRSDSEKTRLLVVSLSDLKAYSKSIEDQRASRHFAKVIDFVKYNEKWEHFLCSCGSSFVDSKSLKQHLLQEQHYLRKHPSDFNIENKPDRINDRWVEMIIKSSWKPLDTSWASKALQDRLTCKNSGDDAPVPAAHPLPIFSHDSLRRELLEAIHSLFSSLIREGCLADTHIDRVLKMAKSGENDAVVDTLAFYGIRNSPILLWCIEAKYLREIHDYLAAIYMVCGSGKHTEKGGVSSDEEATILEGVETADPIALPSREMPRFIIPGALPSDMNDWLGQPEAESRVKMRNRDDILKVLEEEYKDLQRLSNRKVELHVYEEELNRQRLCLEDMRKNPTGCSHYDTLQSRLTGLLESSDYCNIAVEYEVLSNILGEAEMMNVDPCAYEEAYGVPRSLFDENCMEDLSHRRDGCLSVAIDRQKKLLSWELSAIDARMMQKDCRIDKLLQKTVALSRSDHRTVVVPLVFSCALAQLEESAKEDAIKRSDAAQEALLSEELMLASEKGGRGTEKSRQGQRKEQSKKKNKKSGKKTYNATGTSEKDVIHDKIEEPDPSSLALEGTCLDSEIIVSSNDNKLEKEKGMSALTFEVEALKETVGHVLEVGDQKHVEYQDKQKLLTHQQHKLMQSSSGSTDDGLLSAYPVSQAAAQDLHEKLEHLLDKRNKPLDTEGTHTGFASAVSTNPSAGPAKEQSAIIDVTDIKQGDVPSPQDQASLSRQEEDEVGSSHANESIKEQVRIDTVKGADDTASCSSSASEHGVADSIYDKKTGSHGERMDRFHLCWKSMSSEEKKELLTVKVPDVKAFFSSSRVSSANEVISEVLEHAGAHKTWRSFVCFKCHEKFRNSKFYEKHVRVKHIVDHLREINAGLPESLDADSTKMICERAWKPLDASAVLRMLEKCDVFKGPAQVDPASSWLTLDDPELIELLENIQGTLRVLVGHNNLAASHLKRILQFIKDELQVISSPLLQILDLTLTCICFLGATQLWKILNFLRGIYQSCELDSVSKKSCYSLHDGYSTNHEPETKDLIVLGSDATLLLMHDHWLPSKNSGSACQNTSGPTSPNLPLEKDPTKMDLISWIFLDSSCRDSLKSWKRRMEETPTQGLKLLEVLQKEYDDLYSLCDRRLELLNYEDAVVALKNLFPEEVGQRSSAIEFGCQRKLTILKKRLRELTEASEGTIILNGRAEIDALSTVLREAETLEENRYVGLYDDPTLRLCGLESSRDADNCQSETCLEVAIHRQKERVSLEICKVDARILRKVSMVKHLERKLLALSSHDYQSLLLPLLKPYIKAKLAELSQRGSAAKSETGAPSLKEHALVSDKGVRVKGDELRSAKKKSKARKGTKISQKPTT